MTRMNNMINRNNMNTKSNINIRINMKTVKNELVFHFLAAKGTFDDKKNIFLSRGNIRKNTFISRVPY